MEKKARKKIIWAFILLIAFTVYTFVVKNDSLNRFDFATTVKIQNYVPKTFDVPLSIFSLIGSFEITFPVLLLIIIRRKKTTGLIALVFFGGAHLVELLGKSFLEHPGPPLALFRYNIPFLFPSSYIQPGSSYPSGHSLRTVFLASLFFFLIKNSPKISRNKKIIINLSLIIFTVLMLFTRVSLGEHWSTDVVGGALLGAAFALTSLIFL